MQQTITPPRLSLLQMPQLLRCCNVVRACLLFFQLHLPGVGVVVNIIVDLSRACVIAFFGSDFSRHEISYCLCGCVVVHLRKLTRYVVGIPYARLLYSMFVVVVVGRRERDMYALTICSLLIISFFLVLCGFSRFYY